MEVVSAGSGWHPSADPKVERYWDGSAWTGHRRVEAGPNSGLVVAGYLGAVLMPVVGLVIALAIGARSSGARGEHGRRIVALSIVMAVVYALIYAWAGS